MDGKGMIQRFFMVVDEDAAARARRRRGRMMPGIERQEDRVVLSRMGMPGGPGGGVVMGRSEIGPMRGPGDAAVEIASCDVSIMPVMPAGAQIMGALDEAGVHVIMGGHIGVAVGPDDSSPKSDDPAIQALLDNLTAALNQQRTNGEAIGAKSKLTVAAVDGLHVAIAGLDAEGLTLDKAAADAAVSSLVRAVAGQADTTQAAAAFTALFADSGVAQEAIDKAISAITRVVTESNLTVADLDTLKADRAAVDAAFQALRDAGYEPFQLAVQSGVAFGGETGVRGPGVRPRKIAPNERTAGDSTAKVPTKKTSSNSNDDSTKIRKLAGAGQARTGRFAGRGIAARRGFVTRF